MNPCTFQSQKFSFQCPLEALSGRETCLWHLPKEGRPFREGSRESPPKVKEALERLNPKIFVGYDLREAPLAKTNFFRSEFCECNLSKADLTDAYLRESRLEDLTAVQAIFNRSNFNRSTFAGSDWTGSRFEGAFLNDCRIQGCLFSQTRFDYAQMLNTALHGCSGRSLQMEGMNLTGSRWIDCKFGNLFLHLGHALNAVWTRCRITEIYLEQALLMGMEICESQVERGFWIGVNMRHARLEQSVFRSCEFRRVDFTDCSFQDCTFKNCRFEDCIHPPLPESYAEKRTHVSLGPGPAG